MALSVTGCGFGASSSSPLSFVGLTPTTTMVAGTVAVVFITYDNASAGGADPFSSITGGGGTWNLIQSTLQDPGGAANSGTAMRAYWSVLVTDLRNGPDPRTMALFFNDPVPDITWSIYRLDLDPGYSPVLTVAGSFSGSTATPSITTLSVTSGGVVFGAVGREGNDSQTDDTDTTNGSWAASQKAGTGAGDTGQQIITQYKTVTANGTQTYNPTFGGVSRDTVGIWAVFAQALTIPAGSPASIAISNSSPTVGRSFVPVGFYSVVLPDMGGLGTLGSLSFSPATRAVSLSGFSPSLALALLTTKATITLGSSAPSILITNGISPASSTVVLTGQAPTITQTTAAVIVPATGAVSLIGFVPGTSNKIGFTSLLGMELGGVSGPAQFFIQVPTGAIPLVGQSPALTRGLSPATGSVAFLGRAPSVLNPQVVLPQMSTVSVTGQAPALTVSDFEFYKPDSATVSVVGQSPLAFISGNHVLAPATYQIKLIGREASQPVDILMVGGRQASHQTTVGGSALVGGDLDPGFVGDTAAITGSGSVQLTGLAPATSQGTVIGVPTGAVNCTGLAPTSLSGTVIVPPVAVVPVIGIAPSPSVGFILQPAKGAITITAPPPAFFVGFGPTPSTYAITLSGFAPKANLTVTIQTGAGSVTLSGNIPQILSSGVEPILSGSIALAGYAPSLLISIPKLPSFATVALTGFAPKALVSTIAQPDTGQVSVTGTALTIQATQALTVHPGAGGITITGSEVFAYQGQLTPIPVDGATVASPQESLTLIEIVETLVITGEPIESLDIVYTNSSTGETP